MTENNYQNIRHDHFQAELIEINNIMQERYVMERAKEMGMPYINISKVPLDLSILNIITKEEAISGMIIPYFLVGDKLKVAVVDINKKETKKIIEQLKSKGYILEIYICSKLSFEQAVLKYDDIIVHKTVDFDEMFIQNIISNYDLEIKNLQSIKEKLKNALPEEILSFIIIGALKTNASDIHLEPWDKVVRLRYRIYGILVEILHFNIKDYSKIVSQVKYQAKLKLNISNLPQDGRILFTIKDRNIDLRISIVPTEYGETIVIRVLDSENKNFLSNFDELGINKENLDRLNSIISKPNGMLIITGPTGSGKTTTLYSILNKINDVKLNIVTIEDPIEYRLNGINQIMVNEDIGLTFTKALKAVLRQDPDIIMLGEIRDLEVANIAAQAAITGHLVLTTLHTNDALSSINRLLNIGMNRYMISPSLLGLIAQRLVRIPCPYCSKTINIKNNVLYKEQYEYIQKHLEIYNKCTGKNIEFYGEIKQAIGCDMCSNTGYIGRIGVFEIFEVDDEFREMIMKESTLNELKEYAFKKGFYTMAVDGVLKLIEQKTTYEELRRILG